MKNNYKNEKTFGYIISIILFFFSIYPNFNISDSNLSILILSLIILFIAIFRAKYLQNITAVWMLLGTKIGHYISKIFMIIFFFIILTPISILAKTTGKKFLQTKNKNNSGSAWIIRKEFVNNFKKQS